MMGDPSGDRDTSQWAQAFIALGSNVGDRIGYLRRGAHALRGSPRINVVAGSPVYESEAHTSSPDEHDPPYLNAVIEVRTGLRPHGLLNVCKQIERGAGRRRSATARWSPRTLDLDLLIFGQEAVRDLELIVPHPRMGERRFVLQPLADLAPDLFVPTPYEMTVTALLDACRDDALPIRIEEPL